jgi:hypothetical protein
MEERENHAWEVQGSMRERGALGILTPFSLTLREERAGERRAIYKRIRGLVRRTVLSC